MKYRMLSLLSIIIVISVKSIEISAHDYHKFKVLVRAIPPGSYVPQIVPVIPKNKLDGIIDKLILSPGIKEMYLGGNDNITDEFQAYEKLKILATEKELNKLLTHESPIVRVYAYRALIVNDMNMDCDIESSLFSDTTCLEWYLDEIPITTTVSELIQAPFKE